MKLQSSRFLTNKNRLLGQIFQITIALWFFRMVLPGMKYLFLPSFAILLVYTILYHRKVIFQKEYFYEFLKTFNPLLILGVFFIGALLLSSHLYTKALRDVFEFGVNFFFLIVFFAITYQSKRRAGFTFVFHKMTRIIWMSAFIVALLGFLKFALQLNGFDFYLNTPWGTAFNEDKNFFALYSMLGIIGLIPRLAGAETIRKRIASQLILLTLILNIVFSYSYRSLLLLVLIGILLLLLQIFVVFSRKRKALIALANNLRLITLILILFISSLFVMFQKNNRSVIDVYDHYVDHVIGTKKNIESLTLDVFDYTRWNYALELYGERPFKNQLFGDGFDYLQDYGLKYKGDSLKYDYPHNPVLSALLYSGLLGAVFVLLFILVSLYYAAKYFAKYPLFALMLFTSMLFVLFSGNSIFSVPIFLFLFSLSFLIRHQEISELNIDLNMNKPGAKFLKEIFDYVLASISIAILSPLLLFLVLLIGFTMGWPVVYTQVRIGQNGKPFKLHKFRSMKKAKSITTVAAQEQNRITWLGKVLRKYKLDELPELWNIIRGDMSFVGPRPDVPGYADVLMGDDRIILQLKPGLTGAASLKYMHEEDLLSQQSDPQEYNDKVIFPDKVLVNKKYMEKWSLWLDLKIITLTGFGRSMHEDHFL